MSIASNFRNYLYRRAKQETLEQLRSIPEKQLIDCGISPALLKEGVKAWPWREEPENDKPILFDQISQSTVHQVAAAKKTHASNSRESVAHERGNNDVAA